MGSLALTILAFIVALAILISVHEFGHFWVARKLGVKVLRFSIGFGKPLWRKIGKVDKTEYVIAAIPLGGYVKMLDERESPVAQNELHRAFNRQSLKIRSAIVIAGPLFNFLFAIFAYWLVFFAGETGMRPIVGEVIEQSPAARAGMMTADEIVSVGSRQTATWENVVYALLASSIENDAVSLDLRDENETTRTVWLNLDAVRPDDTQRNILEQLGVAPFAPVLPAFIGTVIANEAADDAGLQSGDLVLQAGDTQIDNWTEWVKIIRDSPQRSLRVLFERDALQMETILIPRSLEIGSTVIGRIGAAAQIPEGFMDRYQAKVVFGPVESLGLAVDKTWDFSVLTLRVLGQILTGDASINNLSGPITIAQTAGKSASIGFLYFVKFLAIVSISLGVLNLLPIPVLDGGHLLYFLLEAFKGSALSEGFMEITQRIGVAILLALMSVAFFVDLGRVFN